MIRFRRVRRETGKEDSREAMREKETQRVRTSTARPSKSKAEVERDLARHREASTSRETRRCDDL